MHKDGTHRDECRQVDVTAALHRRYVDQEAKGKIYLISQ